MKIQTLALVAFSLIISASACKKGDFKKTETGLEYQILLSNDTGRQVNDGDLITFHVYGVAGDSVFLNTFQYGMPFQNLAMASQYPGDIYEGFKLLKTGDSAIFKLNTDSLFQRTFNQKETPDFAIGKEVLMTIKMVDVMGKAAMEAQQAEQEKEMEEMKRKQEENAAAENALIEDYIKSKGLKNVQSTETGLRYIVLNKGKGRKLERGDKVKVHYTGTLLNGNKFDSSVDRGQPFEFEIGYGQVILGWDEGLMLMSIGDKYKLIIPFNLGYGYAEQPNIPAFSTLVFDVEVLDATPAPTPVP